MSVVDRYLARMFVSSYLILLAVGIGMYTLTDLLVNIDEFTENRELPFTTVAGLVVDFYGHNMPLYYSMLGGPALAMAAAFTLGRLLKNNEQVALVAAGVPLQRLLVPLVVCTLVLTGLWMANREIVVPALAPKISRQHEDVFGKAAGGVYCARDAGNRILTALRIEPRSGELRRVYIIEPDASGRPGNLIEADAARYDADRRVWLLERGRRIRMDNPQTTVGVGQRVKIEAVDVYPFGLTPQELLLRRGSEWADLLSLRQLNQLVRTPNLPNRPTIEMTRHIRLTQPLLQWVVLLLTVPFFLTREPENIFAAGGKALLVGGLFFLVTFIAHGIVREDAYSALAAWLPVLFFGPVAALLVANVRT